MMQHKLTHFEVKFNASHEYLKTFSARQITRKKVNLEKLFEAHNVRPRMFGLVMKAKMNLPLTAWGCYRPVEDAIFFDPVAAGIENIQRVQLHELVHWTQASSRCNRIKIMAGAFGKYWEFNETASAIEECVAEMGATMVMNAIDGRRRHMWEIGRETLNMHLKFRPLAAEHFAASILLAEQAAVYLLTNC